MDKVQVNELVLQHWGIKGQKWGRRRYQNKDGSLTPEGRKRYGEYDPTTGERKPPKLTRKQRKEQARKEAEEAKAREEAETVEQKRERLLKSSDAGELYKNRDLLSTAEINERLNRIDTERRLAKAAEDAQPAKKTITDRVDSALKVGRKINEVYEFTNTPVMKALKKKLGIEKGDDEKSFDIKKLYENRDKLSNKDVQDAANRAENYKKLKNLYDDVTGDSNKSNDTQSQNQSQTKQSNKGDDKPDSTPDVKPDSGKKKTKTSSEPFSVTNVSETAKKLADEFDSNKTSKELKSYTDGIAKKMDKINKTSISDAKKEVQDALDKVPKSDALKKAAAVEVAKEVGPELGEVISAFNEGIMKANQKRLDDAKKNN